MDTVFVVYESDNVPLAVFHTREAAEALADRESEYTYNFWYIKECLIDPPVDVTYEELL